MRLVLAQTARVVATLDHFEVWPGGVQFTVLVQTKGLTWDQGSGRPPTVFGWDPQREREMASSVFDLEFVYPGRPAADISFEHNGHSAVVDDGGDPVLTILGGNGGVDEQDMGRWGTRFWLTPLPPTGATVRCTWADDDLNQTVGFDVDALNDAASAAQVLTD